MSIDEAVVVLSVIVISQLRSKDIVLVLTITSPLALIRQTIEFVLASREVVGESNRKLSLVPLFVCSA